MSDEKDLLAYCGFYCGDCLGYTGVIADAAENLKNVLEKYRFDRTAECIFPEELKDYDKFVEMLRFMAGLRCKGKCRDEDPGVHCEVKKCCREKGFFACHECDGFETCGTFLSVHKGLHTESCIQNLREILDMGLDAWLERGKRHCYWDDAED